MEAKQLKNCILNLICVLLVVIAKIAQTYIFIPENIINREINLYIGLIITIPAFVFATVKFVIVAQYHLKNKIIRNYLFLLIPYILLALTIFYYLMTLLIGDV